MEQIAFLIFSLLHLPLLVRAKATISPKSAAGGGLLKDIALEDLKQPAQLALHFSFGSPLEHSGHYQSRMGLFWQSKDFKTLKVKPFMKKTNKLTKLGICKS